MDDFKGRLSLLLAEPGYAGIRALSKNNPQVLRRLISLTYDRGSEVCWRAIEAIGEVSSDMSPEEARKTAQRVLWMMRDESGGNAWSGPDILGEIVRANPSNLADIAPIIASFHEEGIFREGVLRALGRIAGRDPGLVAPERDMISGYLSHPDPAIRGVACYALGSLGDASDLKGLLEDKGRFEFYIDGELKEMAVSQMALRFLK